MKLGAPIGSDGAVAHPWIVVGGAAAARSARIDSRFSATMHTVSYEDDEKAPAHSGCRFYFVARPMPPAPVSR